MKKILIFLIVGLLTFSDLGTIANSIEGSETITLTKSVTFLEQPTIEIIDEYLRVNFNGANSKLRIPKEPELPVYIATFILPKQAEDIKVKYTPGDTDTMKIPREVTPVVVYPLGFENTMDRPFEKNEQVYNSNNFYPNSWYDYNIGHGLDGDDHVIFVKIVCNIVRYSPGLSSLKYLKEIDIAVTYNNPGITCIKPDVYDMVIITPEIFVDEFQPLVDHKNSYGINTTLKIVEDILVEFDGFDAPEKIKYFIKDAIEGWGISYVLFGGGLKSHFFANDRDDCNQGTKDWFVPVRYTNIESIGSWPGENGDPGCLSDLYYADIYNGDGTFSSWDSNDDGVYAALDKDGIEDDVLDLYPDVYVGRLPCRNELEVELLVNKIIFYESTYPFSKPWFKKMIGIAGRTFENHDGKPDGEILCDLAISYMDDIIMEPVRVYASNRDTGGLIPVSSDIIEVLYGGTGLVIFEGHGSPFSWNTHCHDSDNWTGGFDISKFWRLFNGNKLPIVVVGGCHNGLYNVTFGKTLRSGNRIIQDWLDKLDENNIKRPIFRWFLEKFLLPEHFYLTNGNPIGVCFSWGLCLVPWGGAIASTGCTGYGYGSSSYPVSLSGELNVNLFYMVGQENIYNLGRTHGSSITKFLNENHIALIETHCITIFELFGDPSLKFGGYQ